MGTKSNSEKIFNNRLKLFRNQIRMSMVYLDTAAGLLNMHATDLVIISCLFDLGTATTGELAHLVNLSNSAATFAVDRLEQAGFVSRESDPNDRRKVIVKLRSMPEKFSKIQKLAENEINKTLNNSDEKEMTLVIKSLERLNVILRNVVDEINKLK